jgi:hypothetical protein
MCLRTTSNVSVSMWRRGSSCLQSAMYWSSASRIDTLVIGCSISISEASFQVRIENCLLEAEADRLCNAGRYERTEARRDQRSGSCDRKLQTKAGEVRLKVPKLQSLVENRRTDVVAQRASKSSPLLKHCRLGD